jgi:predicted type IV restriction endonuclease
MPLDDLVQVIETIQQRIRDHGDSLRQNETRTRMALIDPLLQALGWDVADPGVVLAEYDLSGQRADYALLNDSGSPATFVEAKKLGESLISHRMQMVNYANMSGVPYAGLTDGNNWELYVVFDQSLWTSVGF